MKNTKPKLTDSEFVYDIKTIRNMYKKGKYSTREAKACIMAEIGVYLQSL